MAATAVVAKLDPASGRLAYACAGHPWPLLVRADGEGRYLEGGRGVPLGCLPSPSTYEEAEVLLAPGATLLLYTDGLTERRGQDLDAVMERIRAAAAAAAPGAAGHLARRRRRRPSAPMPPTTTSRSSPCASPARRASRS